MARRLSLRVALVVIGALVVSVLIAGASFYFLNRTNGTITSSGQRREYLLYVPPSYDRATPTPLVISMHALALWPAAQMETSHWNDVADEHGFIVVYRSGTGVLPKMWPMKQDADQIAGVRFMSELIDTLKSAYNIDPARIYANGFSNGGGMAFVLSCTLSDRIAAVGMVAAAQVLPWNWCADTRPLPMVAFHGTADRIVPYDGGPSSFFDIPFPRVEEWTANWARRNRCGPNPVESVVAADVSRLARMDGRADEPPHRCHECDVGVLS